MHCLNIAGDLGCGGWFVYRYHPGAEHWNQQKNHGLNTHTHIIIHITVIIYIYIYIYIYNYICVCDMCVSVSSHFEQFVHCLLKNIFLSFSFRFL